ncbi:uncharacterized protein KGF55_004549 [Candida pseudojiufengensis]|uniref:uncharacterized protein n=1 Tax=Candida pseudojiufengensis TaxID=497109 RepID=UPI0022252EB9|nr:uncharacterized protein KGF55_004549 [Candida pseudojiufengensis]KAI5960656.1 hypothetical protein KGF55_004549 [Candida pseudojiufengensis]
MMENMKAEVRRCRRCKRKRIDDEPMEVRQFKTCAKCRIIERNKKNSRKPLAEETMLYGLKQFREQQSTENYIEEEGLLKDEFFKRYHNKPFNYDVEIRKVLGDPNYVAPTIVNMDESVISADTLSPGGTRYQMTLKPIDSQAPLKLKIERIKKPKPASIPRATHARTHNYHQQQQKQLQHHQSIQSSNIPLISKPLPRSEDKLSRNHKEVFISDSEELDSFKKYLRELGGELADTTNDTNPYSYPNVYGDLDKFLLKITELIDKKEKFNDLVFLKEFDKNFCDEMSEDSYGEKDVTNTQIFKSNEKQGRINLLSNLKVLFINTIAAAIRLDFEQKSTNLHDYKYSSNIRSYYQHRDLPKPNEPNQELKNSSISLSFNKKYQILTIKVSYEISIPGSIEYSPEFKKLIYEVLKKFAQSGNNITFDKITGIKVYEQLKFNLSNYNSNLSTSIGKLNKEKFIKDFVNFEKDMKELKDEEEKGGNNKEDEEVEKDEDEADELDDVDMEDVEEKTHPESDDSDEESDDEGGNEVNTIEEKLENTSSIGRSDTITGGNRGSTESVFTKKEATAEILDPIFKP